MIYKRFYSWGPKKVPTRSKISGITILVSTIIFLYHSQIQSNNIILLGSISSGTFQLVAVVHDLFFLIFKMNLMSLNSQT